MLLFIPFFFNCFPGVKVAQWYTLLSVELPFEEVAPLHDREEVARLDW